MFPESNATGQLLTSLATGLAREGVEVRAFCAQPSYFKAGRIAKKQVHDGVVISRLWTTRFGRTKVIGRIFDAVTFIVASMLEVRVPRDAVTLVVTNPPLLPVVAAFRRLLFRSPFVLLVHDVYPEAAVQLGVVRPYGLLHRVLQIVDGFTLSQADAVVVLGRDMSAILKAKLSPWKHGRLFIVPNWADGSKITPMKKSESLTASRQGLLDTFVVQYSGNVGLSQGLDSLVEAAYLLREKNVTFTVVGDGVHLEKLKSLANGRQLDNILFLPRAEWATLNDSLAACDVALVPLLKGMEGLSVPSKYYGILASGRPVLAAMSHDAEVAQSVTENRCGLVSPPGDFVALAAQIQSLQQDPRLLHELSRNARTTFEKFYTRELAISAYYGLLDRLWNPDPHAADQRGRQRASVAPLKSDSGAPELRLRDNDGK